MNYISLKEKESYRMLILGNGFDLGHDLPTSYADFLIFCRMILPMGSGKYRGMQYQIYDDKVVRPVMNRLRMTDENYQPSENVMERLKVVYGACCEGVYRIHDLKTPGRRALNKFFEDLYKNAWYEYFDYIYSKELMVGNGWVDFEWEIGEVIKWLNDPEKRLEGREPFERLFTDYILRLSAKDKLKTFFDKMSDCHKESMARKMTISDYAKLMYEDLQRLSEALEIYLYGFVNQIPVSHLKNQIKRIRPDFVLSFNYTDTFQRLYDPEKKCEYCYVHGKCRDKDVKYEAGKSNIVIGCGSVDVDREDNFSLFRKYSQRSLLDNPTVYTQWEAMMQQAYKGNRKSEIWICGHSLDVTDGDILNRFLTPEYTSINIIARSQDRSDLNTNLIKLIGEENFRSKSESNPKYINFYNMQ